MNLKKIGKVREGKTNIVSVCEGTAEDERYTLWEVKKHSCAKMLVDMQRETSFAECFIEGEVMCVLLDYEEPRPLARFYQGSAAACKERKQIYKNIIAACTNSGLPYPVLYLLLREKCLNIRRDGSIFFSYYILLDDLDPAKGEKDCVRLCAGILAELMELHGKKEERSCLALMQKKMKRNAYSKFTELHHDIGFIDGRKGTSLLWGRIPYPEQSTKDKIFRILLVLAVILALLAVVLFVSQIIFGELPALRMFSGALQRIGTESLLK